MAFEFRTRIQYNKRYRGYEYFIGMCAVDGDRDGMVSALQRFSLAIWAKPFLNPDPTWNPANEYFVADLGTWPLGLKDIEVEDMRAALIEAGFADTTEAV